MTRVRIHAINKIKREESMMAIFTFKFFIVYCYGVTELPKMLYGKKREKDLEKPV